MKTPPAPVLYVVAGVAVLAGLALLIRNAGAVGQAVGKGVVDIASGTVKGVGLGIGIPLTDRQKCDKCKAIRDKLGVSKFCSAAEFIRWIATGK